MKARVKATGEIVEVIRRIIQGRDSLDYVWYYREDDRYFKEYELEFVTNDILDNTDYWEKLEHQYAGMVFKSFLDKFDNTTSVEKLMDTSIKLAKIFINKLKKKSQCEK